MTAGTGSWLDWAFKIFNFAVLVAILVKFASKPLINFLRSRTLSAIKAGWADSCLKEAEV